MSYTTRSKVEQYMNADLSSISSEVANWILSVKAWIDNYCQKTFEATSETRYYDGNRKDRIVIDSFVGTPSSVQLLNFDGSADTTLVEGAGNDYVAYPLNTTQKYELVLQPNASRSRFSRVFENILDNDDRETDADIKRVLKVTATFGASTTVPADVELAATKLVAKIAETRVSGGEVKSESLGDYSVSFKDVDEAAEILGVESLLAPHVDIDL